MADMRQKIKDLKKDWKDADSEGQDFERLPKGDYTGNIYDIELTESSNDNPMVKVQIAVDSPGFEGRYVWDNLVLTEKALPIAKQKLAKLGLDVNEFGLDELEEQLESLRGAAVSFRLSYKANADGGDDWPRIKYRSAGEDENPTRGKKTQTGSSKGSKKKGKKKGKARKF